MVLGLLSRRRRAKLRAQPVPPASRAIVERNLPVFRRLSAADQAELLGHVQVFLAEKHFEGCGGLALTDEIRVAIAAQACLLLLHRDTDYYPRLRDRPVRATDAAEFFAVVTEAFLERPHALRRRHPELYETLARFYRQDPVGFVPESAAPDDGITS